MRLIDADVLMDVFRGEKGAKALDHFALRLIKVKKIVDEAPTIDAIPVDWLREKMRGYASTLKSTELSAVVCVMQMWDKEQEAQDG